MVNIQSESDKIVNSLNQIISTRKDCVVNIINDKLTLSVFALLEKNLANVKEINLIITSVD